jgi:hypothetical protein
MSGICWIGILRPHPSRKENVDAARFHVPRRHREDQRTWPFDLAARHGHQMIDNAVNMPIRLEFLRLASMVPGRRREVPEALLIAGNIESLDDRERSLRKAVVRPGSN